MFFSNKEIAKVHIVTGESEIHTQVVWFQKLGPYPLHCLSNN